MWAIRFSLFSFAVGLLFFAASLTPSLIPRDPILQGILGGRFSRSGISSDEPSKCSGWPSTCRCHWAGDRGWIPALLVIATLALSLVALRYSVVWQDDLRVRMGIEPIASADFGLMLSVAVAIFLLAMLFGLVVSVVFCGLRALMLRVMPERRANVLSVLAVALALFLVTRDGLIDSFVAFLDTAYESAQRLFDEAPPVPTDPRIPGSAESLVGCAAMGQPRRDFVTSGPDAAAISSFTG